MKTPRILAASIAAFLVTGSLHAQTWDGGGAAGGSLLWSLNTNWNPDGVPVNNGTANLTFGGTIDLAPDMDANWNIASLAFNSGAGAFTLGSTGGFTLTIGAGGITNNSTNLQVISHAITLGAAQTWTTTTNVPIFVTGAVNNGGNLLTLAGIRDIDISGVLSGAGGLTVGMSSFEARLSGTAANTFTGTTTVNAGFLNLTKTAGVDAIARDLVIGDGIGGANADEVILFANDQINDTTATNTVTINSSGRLNLNSRNETLRFLTLNGGSVATGIGTLTFTGATNNLTVNASSASASISGNLNLGAATRIFDVADSVGIANDLNVTAIMSNGGITKNGAGSLRLAAANTFASSLSLNAGTLIVANNAAAGTGTLVLNGGTIQAEGTRTLGNVVQLGGDFTVAGGAADSLTFSNEIGQTGGTRALTKAGAGTLVFSGAVPNTYTGVTTVNEGTLQLAKTVTSIAGNLVIGDGVGSDTVTLSAANQILDASSVTVASSGTFNLQGFSETVAGLTVNGGSVTIGAGTLSVGGSASMTAGNISSAGAGSFVLNGNLTINTSASAATISNNLGLGANTRTFTVADGAAANDLDITAVVSNGGILKTGAGLLRLAGNNTFASGLNVNGGTLVVATDSAASTGTLTLTSGTLHAEGTRVLTNAVTLAGDFNVGGAGSLTLSASILQSGGARALTKAGAGTLVFSGAGANTYTGSTTINEGTLELSKTAGVNAIGGVLVIGDGVGIDSVKLTASNQIADLQTVTINSTDLNNRGLLDLNGNSDTISVLNMTGGVATFGFGTLTLNDGLFTNSASTSAFVSTGTVNLAGTTSSFAIADGTAANDADISAVITNGGITKTGAGLLLLSAANTFAGGLTVSAGTVAFGSNTAAGTGALTLGTATVTTDGGARQLGNSLVFIGSPTLAGLFTFTGTAVLQTTPTITVTSSTAILSGVISEDIAGRGLTKAGTGSLRLGGANSYTGTTTVNAGSIEMQGIAISIPGNLVIGDGVGVDTVSYFSSATDEKIANTSAVTLNSSGTLALDAHIETIGSLTFNGGAVTATTGTLVLGGDVTSNPSTSGALISATLGLGGVTRIFNVADGGALNDLDLQGIVSNGSITKTGAGRLRLGGAAANAFTGTTTVNDGTLVFAKSVADGTIAGPLVIGDASGADVVRLEADEQIANAAALTFNSAGLFDLNGFSETVGALAMTGGAITTGAGTLTLGGNVTTSAHTAAATISGALNLGGAVRTFTVANGAAAVDLDITATMTNGGVNKQGAGTMNINGTIGGAVTLSAGTLGGAITISSTGSYTQTAGIFTGSLTNQGAFTFSGGSFTGSLNTQGTATFNASFTAGSGIENTATLTINSGVTLTANGTGLVNLGTLTLNNGTLAGAGAVNDFGGLMNARGTISAAFTNNGTLDLSGLLTLGAASSNAGEISIATAESLRANAALSNTGSIVLSGGSVTGPGTVTNAAGGVIEGRGAVSAPMAANAGLIHATGLLTLANLTSNAASGELRVDAGQQLNVTSGFTNAGFISLRGTDAQLAGGALANAGTLSGIGRVTNVVTNTGTISASAGGLTLAGSVSNSASGRIVVNAGAQLLASSGLASNAGTLILAGGAFDNNGQALASSGQITGFGSLTAGSLSNTGQVTLTADSSIFGDVSNAAGGRIVTTAGTTTTFFDEVVHNGIEIRTGAGGSSIFLGLVSGAGPFTGTGQVVFEGIYSPGNSPASVSYGGDIVFGGASSLTLEIGGLLSGAQYDHLSVGGTLHADGDLVLALLGGYQPHLGDTFDLLDVGTFAGDFDSITAPALSDGNAWDFSALKTTGSVSVVPEPGIAPLLLGGLALLGMGRMRAMRRR